MKNRKRKSHEDEQLFYAKAVLTALITDVQNILGLSNTDYQRDLLELNSRFTHEGIGFATHALPLISKGLLNFIETGEKCFPGFKTGKNGFPLFLKGVFAYICDPDKEKDALAVDWLYCFSNTFKKLRGDADPRLLKKQLESFVCTDKSLPNVFNNSVIKYARDLMTSIFYPITIDEDLFYNGIKPSPGPGACATKTHPGYRYRPGKWYNNIAEEFNPAEWFYAHVEDSAWHRAEIIKVWKDAQPYPHARFTFVPKKVGEWRGICLEENDVMFMQQGVKNFLYNWLEKHPITKGFINFTDQSINGKIALKSSHDKEYATLDMKEASDRIPRWLVNELFSDIPVLQRALNALSTPVIDFTACKKTFGFDGYDRLITRKYAPMGSALCFPIMALVHFVLIKSIIYHETLRSTGSNVYVYGDDIIVESQYADILFQQLPHYGMVFNKTKSFINGNFRESCGIHAYKGVNITPVYIKYTPGKDFSATNLISIIKNEKDYWDKGYYTCCESIRRMTFGFYHKSLYNVGIDSPCLGWKRPSEYVSPYVYKQRYNEDLQRIEYLCTTIKPVSENYSLIGHSALMRSHVQCARTHENLSPRALQIKLRKRWIPLSILKG